MKIDALNRRSRFAPANSLVRRLVLTDADLLIFEAINRHGPLPKHYLYEFTKHLCRDYTPPPKPADRVLQRRRPWPATDPPAAAVAGFEARYQHLVYDLAPRAKALLAERGRLARYAPRRTDPFLHQLMQACVASSIELAARERAYGTFLARKSLPVPPVRRKQGTLKTLWPSR